MCTRPFKAETETFGISSETRQRREVMRQNRNVLQRVRDKTRAPICQVCHGMGPSRQGPPWRPKLLFPTSISLVTVTLFARCFPKISNLFVSRFSWCRPILHGSLDRTLGRPILLLKLIVSLNTRKRWRQPFYATREHCCFLTNIAIETKIRYLHFWTNVTPLPIGHFITLRNNSGLNSKNVEDIEITNK